MFNWKCHPIVLATIGMFLQERFTKTLANGQSSCSHSFAYQLLCPDPMFVSSGGGSIPDLDMVINLRKGQLQPGGSPHTCNFVKDRNDVAAVTGIHLSEQPWSFHAASKCNHVVKITIEPHGAGGSGPPICRKETGMRLHKISEEPQTNVYFWHNFTFGSYQANFADLITNHDRSPWDIACTSKPEFVQVIILTSRSSKCTLLVQQYKVDIFRSGCDSINFPQEYSFCGAYDCSQAHNVLQSMKLTKHIKSKTSNKHGGRNSLNQGQGSSGPYGKEDTFTEDETGNGVPDVTTTTTGPNYHKSESEPTVEEEEVIIDWEEWGLRLLFPAIGIAFIIFLLSILQRKYSDQICRGRPGESFYHGSSFSIQKQGL